MASPLFTRNECLCYIQNKFDKATIQQLKLVVSVFYTDDEVHAAKELLHACIIALNSTNSTDVPRLVKRKALKVAVDDLVDLFSFSDERGLRVNLPTFAAVDLARLPTVAIEDTEIFVMAQKLQKFEARLFAVESVCSSATSDSAPPPPPIQQVPGNSTSTGADAVQGGGLWSTVVRKTARKSKIAPTSADGPSPNANDVTRPTRTAHRKKLVGNNTNADSKITSAVKVALNKKSVFHIDNVGGDVTVDDIKGFLQSNDVRVETCFNTKSWMRQSAQFDIVDVAAFRLCIHADDKQKLCSPDFWPAGVVVRDWKFKGKSDSTNINPTSS